MGRGCGQLNEQYPQLLKSRAILRGTVRKRLSLIVCYRPSWLYSMIMMMMLFAILLLSVGGAQALPWDGARPTDDLNLPLRYQEPPKPTALAHLRKRQAPGDIICAWENGIGSSSK